MRRCAGSPAARRDATRSRQAMRILAGGQPLTLLAERAAWIERSRTLLVADVHIGKAVTFRALGVPVPRGTTSETLAGLGRLIERTGARRVVFLGDFLHSAKAHAASTLGALARWRANQRDVELVLVRGNHDARAGSPPPFLGIEVVAEPFVSDGLALCHHPVPHRGAYVVAGHLHPCVGLSGRVREFLRLPCFWFGDQVGVLPAFGAFTGMQEISPRTGDRVFAVADDAVCRVPWSRPRLAA
jgi:DNA ligase-associated metallophosphoesterase